MTQDQFMCFMDVATMLVIGCLFFFVKLTTFFDKLVVACLVLSEACLMGSLVVTLWYDDDVTAAFLSVLALLLVIPFWVTLKESYN